ncbi:Uncharacterised protein [Mycobacteroides abscessus]|nr:Uncharacterised protein [Mycobacteroides abscessus]CPS17576.1 Uncharacterised protein [Mycobacteroides abscessus]CPS22732.1 Uncharacterised protein [Mycobacteroides abscessus]CPS90618.1 Uncharacterised protein [Mycobacteroides abscessus]CPT45559.1 Uncharacterised protein [Mycobacteroides abscessus]
MDVPSDAVGHKEVVIALVGASATIVGLILVFIGLVVSAYGALAGDTPKSVKDRLRRTAGWLLVPFALGLVQILVGTIWLLYQSCGAYDLTVALFIATVVTLAAAAFWTLRRLMWD